jgi:polysaccharide export outer membrane protein
MKASNVRSAAKVGGLCALVLALCAGCFSLSPGANRLERYRPDERRRGPWLNAVRYGTQTSNEMAVVAERDNAVEPAVQPQAAEPGLESKTPGSDVQTDSGTPIRLLVRGDRLTISLLGIPEPQQIEDVIDDSGNISLPHIGDVRVVDRRTSEAESAIRRAYIDGQIYRDINVIIVSKDDEFFVRGEVKREGRYSLTGAMTLVKAISVAGGYTEFADKNEAEIMRGDELLKFDMKRIHEGRDRDPPIKRGDIVNVRRRWIW